MIEEVRGTLCWATLLHEATDRLAAAGHVSPEVDARRLVEEAAGREPAEFLATLGETPTERAVARFDHLMSRRLAGEPLQYVVGHWGFRYLDLLVDARVLIPRPETEIVAGLAIDEVIARGEREVVVVDLGTGSGAIALAVATECDRARVLATDRSAAALQVARANLAGVGSVARRVTLHHGSWFAAVPDSVRGKVDVLVSNPPYVAHDEVLPNVVADWEPSTALRAGPVGTEDLETIIAGAKDWVVPGGVVVLEMAPEQTAPVARRCIDAGWTATVHQDLAGRERAVVAHRPWL